jgi:hypothetical protein
MTRDDIIRMAREANLWMTSDERIAAVERFAALVAAAEREACAKLCDELRDEDGFEPYGTECAAAIRARGEEQLYATQAAMVESQTHGRIQIDPATGNVSIGAIRARRET